MSCGANSQGAKKSKIYISTRHNDVGLGIVAHGILLGVLCCIVPEQFPVFFVLGCLFGRDVEPGRLETATRKTSNSPSMKEHIRLQLAGGRLDSGWRAKLGEIRALSVRSLLVPSCPVVTMNVTDKLG